jgi:hypothetical protein
MPISCCHWLLPPVTIFLPCGPIKYPSCRVQLRTWSTINEQRSCWHILRIIFNLSKWNNNTVFQAQAPIILKPHMYLPTTGQMVVRRGNSKCKFVHHEFYMDYSGIELRPLRWEPGDQRPEIWHGQKDGNSQTSVRMPKDHLGRASETAGSARREPMKFNLGPHLNSVLSFVWKLKQCSTVPTLLKLNTGDVQQSVFINKLHVFGLGS